MIAEGLAEGLTGDGDASGGDALETTTQEHESEVLRAGEHCMKSEHGEERRDGAV